MGSAAANSGAAAWPGLERPIDVVVADDHAVVRDGLKALLAREPKTFRVVGEAATVPEVVEAVTVHEPDLLTLDLTMPGGSSLAALPLCFRACPGLAVVVLTMRDDPGYASQALRAGVRGYLLKDAEPEEILNAFRLVVGGGQYLQPALGALLVSKPTAPREEVALSDREREVVRLAALGYTNAEIGQRLHIGERTVKTYRSRAMDKLGISRRAELVEYARREGLMEDPIGISARLGKPPVLSWPPPTGGSNP